MSDVRLVCWKQELAQARASDLERSGFRVNASPLDTGGLIGEIRASSPAAILIDLDRLPSHGREVAVALRRSRSTRGIPIVFAGGLPEKIERIRQELPDALFTDWSRAPAALKKALRYAPIAPIQPVAHMERYAGSPLVKKLGLKAEMKAALLAAPEDFVEKLGDLPANMEFRSRIAAQTKLALWFVRSRGELESEIEYIAARLPQGSSLWIIYPKQTGRYKVDFNQTDVRRAGLNAGLVDYKVCAVDSDWSGLKFARKRS